MSSESLTLREQMDALGWAKSEPRSGYDLALFCVVDRLVSEIERLSREVAKLSLILDSADRFATHDPGVDWPSSRHTDPMDAIMAALDDEREQNQERLSSGEPATLAGLQRQVDELRGELVQERFLRQQADSTLDAMLAAAEDPHRL